MAEDPQPKYSQWAGREKCAASRKRPPSCLAPLGSCSCGLGCGELSPHCAAMWFSALGRSRECDTFSAPLAVPFALRAER
jgi:hypothetical protein